MSTLTPRELVIVLCSTFPISGWVVRTFATLAERHGVESVDRWWRERRWSVFRESCAGLLRQGDTTEVLSQRAVDRLDRFFQRHPWQSLLELAAYWHQQNRRLAKRGVRITTYLDQDWPACLPGLSEPPSVLWSTRPLGPFLARPCLAVVGSRDLTHYGGQAATYFGKVLGGDYGLTIVSGCARGADWITQKAALGAGGRSIGLLGCGITRLPAPCQDWLANPRFVLVSEFAPFAAAAKWHFPYRNRLIAGFAAAVLVVEAGQHSGSFITVKAAREQGKSVMILSQPCFNDNTHGLQAFAGEGSARVVVRPENVLEELGITGQSGRSLPGLANVLSLAQTPAEKQVLTTLYQRGGQSFASELSAWEDACLSLEARHIISEQLGVYQLSGMIQS